MRRLDADTERTGEHTRAPNQSAVPTGHALLGLQSLAGNLAVSRLVARDSRSAAAGLVIQRSFEEAGGPGTRPNLDVGDSGPGVALLQHMVGATLTGVFDQQTRSAVDVFQRQQDWQPSGVGQETWARLDGHAGAPARRPGLGQGNRGPGVRLLQHLLGITETAVFGTATRAAVDAFQRRQGWEPSGVGDQTWARLESGTGPSAGEFDPTIPPPGDPPGTVGKWNGWPYVVYDDEVHVSGDSTFMNNNPGNILAGGDATALGAFPGVTGHFGPWAVFPTYAIGREAIHGRLRSELFQQLTVQGAISMWVTGKATNVSLVQDYVNTVLGLVKLPRTGTPRLVSSLDATELDGMVAGIVQHEGKPVGTAVTCHTTEARLQWARIKLGCPPPGRPGAAGTSDAGAGGADGGTP